MAIETLDRSAGVRPHRFTRAEYYAMPFLDRTELLEGIVYDLSPINPPHAAVIKRLVSRFRQDLDSSLILQVQDPLEIEPKGSPQPDIAIVKPDDDYYDVRHPNGDDALLVIEVGDTERNPREKMKLYMRDGRIPVAWRIDIPNRCVELWAPIQHNEPVTVLSGAETFSFEGITFVADSVFSRRNRPRCDPTTG